ncbi:MAG TPA: energy transducer TonB, partial [Dokdonella sp.]
MHGAATPAQLGVALIVFVVVSAAIAWWWFNGTSGLPSLAPSAAPTAAPGADEAPSAAAADLGVDDLYRAARGAMAENRMVAPAGSNAFEYYLRILAKQPDDGGATDALRELFPFASASAEERINQNDFDEANRIIELLAKADPSNYTLTILRSKLDAKKKQNDREQAQQQVAATTRPSAPAAASPAPSASPSPPPPPPQAVASAAPPAPAPAANVAPRTVEAARTPASAPPPAPAAPAGESREVVVVTPPRPSYPASAVRNRTSGWVEVEFTVAADGAVQNA